jgi:hypothetical protein
MQFLPKTLWIHLGSAYLDYDVFTNITSHQKHPTSTKFQRPIPNT